MNVMHNVRKRVDGGFIEIQFVLDVQPTRAGDQQMRFYSAQTAQVMPGQAEGPPRWAGQMVRECVRTGSRLSC